MEQTNEGFKLSTGQEIALDCFPDVRDVRDNAPLLPQFFTPDERAEIAAFMVNLWIEWGTKE
ncbi:MAG TPA: hypothetical protein DCP69_01660 [Candidatus Omnitrophica bacterium]|nr:hypothetical protein [Candidatus Omnitrophota bacterium]